MQTRKAVIFGVGVLLASAALLSGMRSIGSDRVVSDFSLKNVDGKFVSLADFPRAKGFIVVFICNHCPFANLYPARINALSRKYALADLPVLAISSTDTSVYEEDSYELMVAKAKDEKFEFPYLFDADQTVAKNFSAQKTPHAFVIWKQAGEWVIKYSGAIDDNGAQPEKVRHNYVAEAIDSLLLGRAVSLSETRSIGCQIHFRPSGK